MYWFVSAIRVRSHTNDTVGTLSNISIMPNLNISLLRFWVYVSFLWFVLSPLSCHLSICFIGILFTQLNIISADRLSRARAKKNMLKSGLFTNSSCNMRIRREKKNTKHLSVTSRNQLNSNWWSNYNDWKYHRPDAFILIYTKISKIEQRFHCKSNNNNETNKKHP